MPGARGRYEAEFMEDCLEDLTIEPFVHRPARLDHWQLLQTALEPTARAGARQPPRLGTAPTGRCSILIAASSSAPERAAGPLARAPGALG